MTLWLMQESTDGNEWETFPLVFRSEREVSRCCKCSSLRDKREDRPKKYYRPQEFASVK